MERVNHFRLRKQAMLPCEVVGLKGDTSMDCGTKNKTKSVSSWKVKFPQVQEPRK